CVGTENKMSLLGSAEKQYNTLRSMYTNCEVVMGNLEITYIRNGSDLSFLRTIREVSGYVLIALNEVDHVPLENLRVVRGTRLYDQRYALTVLLNYNDSVPEERLGLKELRLTRLTEILRGGVYVRKEPGLPSWDDIRNRNSKENFFLPVVACDFSSVSLSGQPCHPSCKNFCWGSGPQYCQTFTSTICAKQCDGRCYGLDPNQCCHKHCASGCTGPRETDCFPASSWRSRASIQDNVLCGLFFSVTIYQFDNPPRGNLALRQALVADFPAGNFVVDYNSCVRSCPVNKTEVEDGSGVKHCKPCPDNLCPKVCDGIGSGKLKEAQTVDAKNIHFFSNCTTISGNLIFLRNGFDGNCHFQNGIHVKPRCCQSLQQLTGSLLLNHYPVRWQVLPFLLHLDLSKPSRKQFWRLHVLLVHKSLLFMLMRYCTYVKSFQVTATVHPIFCFVSTLFGSSLYSTKSNGRHCCACDRPGKEGYVCDALCSAEGCWGPGPMQCLSCKFHKRGKTCVESCSVLDGDEREFVSGALCIACHAECMLINGSLTCHGPGPDNCTRCRNYREGPHCVGFCPEGVPGESGELIYKYPDEDGVCHPCHYNCTQGEIGERHKGAPYWANVNKVPVIAAGVVSGLFAVFLLLLALFIYKRHQNALRKRTLRKYVENERPQLVQPLTPSGAQPNQAQLRILKETELKKGKVLGSGAFGTVYKGIWVPEGESVKIAVAVKVLRDSASSKANKDILDEAYLMASVDHPHLVRLLGICMSSTTQLVTQLMPHGCLLEYVREHRGRVGSQLILNWCVQIAKNASEIQALQMVCDDLVRLVMSLRTPPRITLASANLFQSIDDAKHWHDRDMPIKWMALESIQYRKFTHQSDVWSYGVTVWELMTFGGKPYDGISARDIPGLLEKGERLPQPPVCTIDVYMIMVKCWMIDAESRPRFSELATDFSKMARDPSRYLVIQGDEPMALPSPTDSKFYKSFLQDSNEE
uniref:receptor protein-tyrosine kinase n=1 Tax=Petromyzon marinus TaxID=7757 RepID=S4RBI1_PETMA